MADPATKAPEAPPLPSLEAMQHRTRAMGRAQQMMPEQGAKAIGEAAEPKAPALPWLNLFGDPAKIAQQQAELWTEGLSIWQRALGMEAPRTDLAEKADRDKRFAAPQWRDNPLFDMIRQSY